MCACVCVYMYACAGLFSFCCSVIHSRNSLLESAEMDESNTCELDLPTLGMWL